MKNNISDIALKFGLIKSFNFTDEFYEANKALCDKFAKLYDTMFESTCSMFVANETHKENHEIKRELCDMLDIFSIKA